MPRICPWCLALPHSDTRVVSSGTTTAEAESKVRVKTAARRREIVELTKGEEEETEVEDDWRGSNANKDKGGNESAQALRKWRKKFAAAAFMRHGSVAKSAKQGSARTEARKVSGSNLGHNTAHLGNVKKYLQESQFAASSQE